MELPVLFRLDGGADSASLTARLPYSRQLIAHRGPDGEGTWISPDEERRVDASAARDHRSHRGGRSAHARAKRHGDHLQWRNLQLPRAARRRWPIDGDFGRSRTPNAFSPAYEVYGADFLSHLRGMFAFALWDERKKRLIAARDRFGIKPFYYALVDGVLYFASEVKALLPFLPDIDTDSEALAEYLTFQYTIGEKTLFKHVHQLLPGHDLVAENGRIEIKRYWDVRYEIDWEHSAPYFERRLRELLNESMALHLRADVPVGSYISGGIDSSLMAILAAKVDPQNRLSLPRPVHRISRLRRIGLRAARRRAIRVRASHVIDISAADFRPHPRRDLAYGFSGRRPRIVSAVHGVGAWPPNM